jgi:hypothetical protein
VTYDIRHNTHTYIHTRHTHHMRTSKRRILSFATRSVSNLRSLFSLFRSDSATFFLVHNSANALLSRSLAFRNSFSSFWEDSRVERDCAYVLVVSS